MINVIKLSDKVMSGGQILCADSSRWMTKVSETESQVGGMMER